MIKNKKTIGFSLIALTGLIAVATCVGVYTPNLKEVDNVGATTQQASDTNLKRLWVTINDQYWESSATESKLWAYYKTPSNPNPNWEDDHQMTLVGYSGNYNDDGFRYGLYYIDIPNDAYQVAFKNYTGSYDSSLEWKQTNDFDLTFESEYSVFYINNVPDGKRPVTQGSMNLNSECLAKVLSIIDSCSTSILDGYNSWNQINKIFIETNLNYDRNHIAYENYTIGEVIDALSARYLAQSNQVNG